MSSTSHSPSRLLLTPPRSTPSPRRALFETSRQYRSASPNGRWGTILLLAGVALVSFLLGVGIGYGSVGGVGVRERHVEPQASSAEPSPPPIPMPGWGDETGSDPDEVFFHIGEEGEKRREGSGRRTETRTFFLLELFFFSLSLNLFFSQTRFVPHLNNQHQSPSRAGSTTSASAC